MRSYTFGMAPMKSLVVCLQPRHHLSSSGAVAERAGTYSAMEAAAPAACVTSEPLLWGDWAHRSAQGHGILIVLCSYADWNHCCVGQGTDVPLPFPQISRDWEAHIRMECGTGGEGHT